MKEKRYQHLTKLRKEKHLSMTTMAERLNISAAYYCQLETKRKRLSYDMAIQIAKVLDLKPDEVFYEDERKALMEEDLKQIRLMQKKDKVL